MRLAAGTHTVQATSPAGSPRLGTANADGSAFQIDGVTYFYDEAQDVYKSRVPPPPSNPPGLWHYFAFNESEGYEKHEQDAVTLNYLHTETGTRYGNG